MHAEYNWNVEIVLFICDATHNGIHNAYFCN